MRILVKGEARWEALEAVEYLNEAELQALLKTGSAELIPADQTVDDKHVSFCRELTSDSGPIDLVGIGSSGSITVMECKLGKNHQIKREVVGQVLDYAAALWQMTPESFIERFTASGGTDPFEDLRSRFGADAPQWDEVACRSEVARRLRDGDLRLLIAVDVIDPQLRRIIEYVNTRGSSGRGLKLVALAFPRFMNGTAEILVPETYGDESVSTRDSGREWDEQTFFQELSKVESGHADVVAAFREWALRKGLEERWGGGPTYGSWSFLIGPAAQARRFVSFFSSGNVSFDFARLKGLGPFADTSRRQALLSEIAKAMEQSIPPPRADTFASMPIARLSDPAVRDRVIAILARVAAEADPSR